MWFLDIYSKKKKFINDIEAINLLQSFRVFHAKLPMKDANDENATRVKEIKQVPPPLYTFWANEFLTNLTNFRAATWLLLPYQMHKYHD